MVKFGAVSLPSVQGVQEGHPRVKQEVPLPGRSWSYRRDRGGQGVSFTIHGIIHPADQTVRDALTALADGTARILDLEESAYTVLEKCFRYQTGPSWTDNTSESQSPGGTPFTLLGASTDYTYFGHREKFNKLIFDLQTIGNYGARTWQYSDGFGGWKTLTPDSDNTSGFTQDGIVAFTPPSDWKQDLVNGVSSKFWVRVSVASVTVAATVNQIQLNLVYNCIMLDPQFSHLVENYNWITYSAVVLQQENP